MGGAEYKCGTKGRIAHDFAIPATSPYRPIILVWPRETNVRLGRFSSAYESQVYYNALQT